MGFYNVKSKEVYYELERMDVYVPFGCKQYIDECVDEWVPIPDSRSDKPIDCEGKKTWRCVKVTITREVL